MKMTCLGSGSAGNCYLLHNETDCLVIEAGVPFKEVKKALNFDIDKICGLLASHGHKDHSGYIQDYVKAGIPIMAPDLGHVPNSLSAVSKPFSVQTFPLVHDVPCSGFLVEHEEIGRLLFITDTEYVRYRFKSINHIMIEANYDPELMCHEEYKRTHVLTGHMSIDTACGCIEANNNDDLRNVILIHLSDGSSNEQEFIDRARNIASCPVYVADRGMEIEL